MLAGERPPLLLAPPSSRLPFLPAPAFTGLLIVRPALQRLENAVPKDEALEQPDGGFDAALTHDHLQGTVPGSGPHCARPLLRCAVFEHISSSLRSSQGRKQKTLRTTMVRNV
jgi:hypothetical protein